MSKFADSILNVLTVPQDIPDLRNTPRELIVDEVFAGLIPPLTQEEYTGLEQSILSEGCREAIITWNNIIIDGHNRYRICKTHNIPYRTEAKDFSSRDDVMLWMLQNQLSRRNLNDFQRVEMVRKYENAVKAQAEKRMSQGVNQYTKSPVVNLPPTSTPMKSRDTLGAMAGVSGSTYEHAIAVLDNAPESVIDATRKKELSINAAYEVTKMQPEKQSEVSQRISNGEKPSKVIADVKQKKSQRQDMRYWNGLLKHAQEATKHKQDIQTVINIVKQALNILETAIPRK